jgi:acyl-CoA synthetase (AMP-forming)/AMP-acid ligase II
VAALVVCDGTHAADVDEVANTVRAALAGYKVPRCIRLVDKIPRLPNGKVDYEAASSMARTEPTAS